MAGGGGEGEEGRRSLDRGKWEGGGGKWMLWGAIDIQNRACHNIGKNDENRANTLKSESNPEPS